MVHRRKHFFLNLIDTPGQKTKTKTNNKKQKKQLSLSSTEKQYKAKWNMKDLEKIQQPAIKKTSVWNGLVIHMPTEKGWAKVFHEVFCSSDGQ